MEYKEKFLAKIQFPKAENDAFDDDYIDMNNSNTVIISSIEDIQYQIDSISQGIYCVDSLRLIYDIRYKSNISELITIDFIESLCHIIQNGNLDCFSLSLSILSVFYNKIKDIIGIIDFLNSVVINGSMPMESIEAIFAFFSCVCPNNELVAQILFKNGVFSSINQFLQYTKNRQSMLVSLRLINNMLIYQKDEFYLDLKQIVVLLSFFLQSDDALIVKITLRCLYRTLKIPNIYIWCIHTNVHKHLVNAIKLYDSDIVYFAFSCMHIFVINGFYNHLLSSDSITLIESVMMKSIGDDIFPLIACIRCMIPDFWMILYEHGFLTHLCLLLNGCFNNKIEAAACIVLFINHGDEKIFKEVSSPNTISMILSLMEFMNEDDLFITLHMIKKLEISTEDYPEFNIDVMSLSERCRVLLPT